MMKGSLVSDHHDVTYVNLLRKVMTTPRPSRAKLVREPLRQEDLEIRTRELLQWPFVGFDLFLRV